MFHDTCILNWFYDPYRPTYWAICRGSVSNRIITLRLLYFPVRVSWETAERLSGSLLECQKRSKGNSQIGEASSHHQLITQIIGPTR